jgi:serine protease Do
MNRQMKRIGLFLCITLVFTTLAKADLQTDIESARDKVMPALVHVEPVKSLYTTGERRHTLVMGSGFIISDDGYVLTNHHVIENAEKVHCTLSNKKKLSAKIIGSDPSTDVAVLQLDLKEWGNAPLPYTKMGNSDSLDVGQIVLALGSPLGLSRSVSMGVISSIDRYFGGSGDAASPYNLWIQTDAAINPGNSGGPLINLKGEAIGINARGVFLAENLGFAIPINLAKEIAEKLIAGEKIKRSWIGVGLQPIKEYRDYLDNNELEGVLVANVDPDSPAEKAGLKAGEVITAINDRPLNAEFDEDLPAIRKIIADLPRGETITLTLWNGGNLKQIKLQTRLEPFSHQPEFECENWGLVVKGINRLIYETHALPDYEGVLVTAVKSGELADKASLRAGDIIRFIDQAKIKGLEDFKKLYEHLIKTDEQYIYFEVLRNRAKYYAVMNREEKDRTSKSE